MKILIVDDQKQHANKLAEPFGKDEVVKAYSLQEAIAALNRVWPDLVILDAAFPDEPSPRAAQIPPFMADKFLEGMYALERAKNLKLPDVILVSGQQEQNHEFDIVINWLRDKRIAGVISKSTMNAGRDLFMALLEHRVDEIREKRVLGETVKVATGAYAWLRNLEHKIITSDPSMIEVSRSIERVAAAPNTKVLIEGESGTGKELVARAIHEKSATRAKHSFVAINCEIEKEFIESVLFGHEKGAFTGAHARKKGLFEVAGMGTVLLDEVGELPKECQAKLLRALQEKRFRRLGGNEELPLEARVISATNKDLRKLIEQGDFRGDLYYRLNVVQIQLPPLRQRKGDIRSLTEHFLAKKNEELAKEEKVRLNDEAFLALEGYEWPGNIRELENAIERLVVFHDGEVDRRQLTKTLWSEVTKQVLDYDQLPTPLELVGVQTWSDLNEKRIDDIKNILNQKLQPVAFEAFAAKVAKAGNNPAQIHYYKALLYLVLHDDHKCYKEDLKGILNLGEAQVQNVILFFNCYPSGIRLEDDEAERQRKELARKEKLMRAENDPNELVFGRVIGRRGKWEIHLKTQVLKSESHA